MHPILSSDFSTAVSRLQQFLKVELMVFPAVHKAFRGFSEGTLRRETGERCGESPPDGVRCHATASW